MVFEMSLIKMAHCICPCSCHSSSCLAVGCLWKFERFWCIYHMYQSWFWGCLFGFCFWGGCLFGFVFFVVRARVTEQRAALPFGAALACCCWQWCGATCTEVFLGTAAAAGDGSIPRGCSVQSRGRPFLEGRVKMRVMAAGVVTLFLPVLCASPSQGHAVVGVWDHRGRTWCGCCSQG